MIAEIDRRATLSGESRSECVRALLNEALVARLKGPCEPWVAQAVRGGTDALGEKLDKRLLAIEVLLEDVGERLDSANDDALQKMGALLWFSSFDEHRAEGGAMDAWLRLALMKSETVLSGGCLDDFDPESGGR